MGKQEVQVDRSWYAIHTYSGYEDAVARNLKTRIESFGMQDKIFNVIVPTEKKIRILAQWANAQPEFVQVLHPALPESPGHGHWMALTGGGDGRAAGLFSVILDARFSQVAVAGQPVAAPVLWPQLAQDFAGVMRALWA